MTNTSKKTAVRIMAWVLAILMILSLATVAISVFADSCDTTEDTDLTHDHNGDGVPDHDDDGHDHSTDGEVDTDDNVDTGDDEF